MRIFELLAEESMTPFEHEVEMKVLNFVTHHEGKGAKKIPMKAIQTYMENYGYVMEPEQIMELLQRIRPDINTNIEELDLDPDPMGGMPAPEDLDKNAVSGMASKQLDKEF